VVKGYRSELFREDLKKLYDRAGVQGQDTLFIFNDTQVR
jgi:dynein heavy chain